MWDSLSLNKKTVIVLGGVWIGWSNPLFAQTVSTALPTGAQIVSGNASVTSSGSQMQVNQTSEQAVVDWNSFNVGAQAGINFSQPNSAAVILNRVTSNTPSQIYGSLTANGQVFLVNPNGVYFGAGSHVDVGGLVASTMTISNSDFNNGSYHFVANSANGIANDGSITAGNIALIAPAVTNNGSLDATTGSVGLASGGIVDLVFGDNQNMSIAVSEASVAAAIHNNGAIRAPNGSAILTGAAAQSLVTQIVNAPSGAGALVSVNGVPTLVSNNGSVQAQNINIDSGANGGVSISGTLNASSSKGNGGSVALTGKDVALGSTSVVNANGATGGGTILVGGGWRGAPGTAQSKFVTIDKGAKLTADAVSSGPGGRIVAWSDVTNPASNTIVHGTLSAASANGVGGYIETSGHSLDVSGVSVNTKGSAGQNGQWLLDPYNITISAGPVSGDAFSASPYTPTTGDSTILASDIINALSTSNVLIDTGNSTSAGASIGDITVNAAITGTFTNDLTLNAANDINVNAAIQNSGTGAINLTAGNNINVGSTSGTTLAAVGSAGGTTTVTAGNDINVIGGSSAPAQIGFNYTSTSQAAPIGDVVVNAGRDVNLLGGSGGGGSRLLK
ncbi:MAG TPA: filamentous hemagglutinin N-terminal domain-containing protein [Halothiobacillus sp.]|nr:filamentous hemagglutinin N-terminal domain-containing protein [Halothiobacillus sp.]